MLSVRSSFLLALLAPTFAFANGSTDTLKGSLLSAEIKLAMTPAEVAKMEEARQKFLNTDSDQVITWMADGKFSGEFKIDGRFTHKENNQPCTSYIHSLKVRATGEFATDTDLKTGKPRPMRIRGFVCLADNAWIRYSGDRKLLLAVNGSSPEPTKQTATAQTPTVAAANGPQGPELRVEHPNMVGPQALGQLAANIRQYQDAINPHEKNKEYVQLVLSKLGEYLRTLVDQMQVNNKTLSLDQTAILLKEIKSESAKQQVIRILKPRIVSVGDISSILTQFEDAKSSSKIRRLLKN